MHVTVQQSGSSVPHLQIRQLCWTTLGHACHPLPGPLSWSLFFENIFVDLFIFISVGILPVCLSVHCVSEEAQGQIPLNWSYRPLRALCRESSVKAASALTASLSSPFILLSFILASTAPRSLQDTSKAPDVSRPSFTGKMVIMMVFPRPGVKSKSIDLNL